LVQEEEKQKENLRLYIDSLLSKELTLGDLSRVKAAMLSEDIFKLHFGMIGVRKILSI